MAEFLINDYNIRSLSIKQPWASMIIDGPKNIENRTWKRKLSIEPCNNWMFVHASKQFDTKKNLGICKPNIQTELKKWDIRSFPTSSIIGLMHIRNIEANCELDKHFWATGPFCWHIDAVIKFNNPIHVNGTLGQWRPPKEIHNELYKEIKNNVKNIRFK